MSGHLLRLVAGHDTWVRAERQRLLARRRLAVGVQVGVERRVGGERPAWELHLQGARRNSGIIGGLAASCCDWSIGTEGNSTSHSGVLLATSCTLTIPSAAGQQGGTCTLCRQVVRWGGADHGKPAPTRH